jgi:hypothetical protein
MGARPRRQATRRVGVTPACGGPGGSGRILPGYAFPGWSVDILSVAIIAFVVIETLNIGILYFRPASRMGNGIGVFNAFRKADGDPETGELVRYLVNWVAGTKLIFVALLLVILATGSQTTKAYAVVALILSILSFFWRLFPAIVRLDRGNQITPPGYSRTLGIMIAGFVGGLAAALALFIAIGRGS